jgi:predicted nucleic acid-binding protein
MTRPAARNGFGLTAAEAESETCVIETGMSFLAENEAVYREWRKVVVQHSVSGVQVLDARLVAVMRVYAVSHILTLNIEDFGRYGRDTAMHPSSV